MGHRANRHGPLDPILRRIERPNNRPCARVSSIRSMRMLRYPWPSSPPLPAPVAPRGLAQRSSGGFANPCRAFPRASFSFAVSRHLTDTQPLSCLLCFRRAPCPRVFLLEIAAPIRGHVRARDRTAFQWLCCFLKAVFGTGCCESVPMSPLFRFRKCLLQ